MFGLAGLKAALPVLSNVRVLATVAALAVAASFVLYLYLSNLGLRQDVAVLTANQSVLEAVNQSASRAITELRANQERKDALLVARGRALAQARLDSQARARDRKEAVTNDEYCGQWAAQPVCPALDSALFDRVQRLRESGG